MLHELFMFVCVSRNDSSQHGLIFKGKLHVQRHNVFT